MNWKPSPKHSAIRPEGLTGSEISQILPLAKLRYIDQAATKWKRIHNAFVDYQNQKRTRAAILAFIRKAIKPTRYSEDSVRTYILAVVSMAFQFVCGTALAVDCRCLEIPSSSYAPSGVCEVIETAQPYCYLEWSNSDDASQTRAAATNEFVSKLSSGDYGQFLQEEYGDLGNLRKSLSKDYIARMRSRNIDLTPFHWATAYLMESKPAHYDGRLMMQSFMLLLGPAIRMFLHEEVVERFLSLLHDQEKDTFLRVSLPGTSEGTETGDLANFSSYGCLDLRFVDTLLPPLQSVMLKTAHSQKVGRC